MSKGCEMLLKRCLLVGRRKYVGKDTADMVGFGIKEDMIVREGSGHFILLPQWLQQECLAG